MALNDYRDRREVHVISSRDNKVMLGGLLAGLIGSIAMLFVLSVGGALSGAGFFHSIQLIATTAYGPEVASDELTTGIVVTGLMIHLLVGITAGLVFGFLADAARPKTLVGLIGAGVAYGLALFLGMFLFVVPSLAPMLGEQQWLTAAIAHVAYGATLAIYWPVTEHLHRFDAGLKPFPLPTV